MVYYNVGSSTFVCEIKMVMTQEEKLAIEERALELLRTVYLGLIYKIDVDDDGKLNIDMTLTAPNCPAADFIVEDARYKLQSIEGVKEVNIEIVFEPEWTRDMMSEEAKLELGFL